MFLCNAWIDVELGTGMIDRIFPVTPQTVLNKFSTKFRLNINFYLRNEHALTSLFFMSPRAFTEMSRFERIAVNSVNSILMISISAFYVSKTRDTRLKLIGLMPELGDYYTISFSDFMVGAGIDVLVSCFGWILRYLLKSCKTLQKGRMFKWSLRYKEIVDGIDRVVRKSVVKGKKDDKKIVLKKLKTCDKDGDLKKNVENESKNESKNESQNESKNKYTNKQRRMTFHNANREIELSQKRSKINMLFFKVDKLPAKTRYFVYLLFFILTTTSFYAALKITTDFNDKSNIQTIIISISSIISNLIVFDTVRLFFKALLFSSCFKNNLSFHEPLRQRIRKIKFLSFTPKQLAKVKKLINRYRETKPLYTPPAYTDMMECYVQKVSEKRLKKSIKLGVLKILYIICQWFMAHNNRHPDMFYFKNSLENSFGFSDLYNLSGLTEFSEKFVATDFDDLGNIGVKIVGRPRIRQVRLGEKTLISPEFQVLNLTTFHPYSIEVSENRDFRENWIHPVDDDNQVDNNTTKFDPWQFKAERGGIQYRGEMVSKYPYGGYYSAFESSHFWSFSE